MRIRHSRLQYEDPSHSTPGYMLIRPVEGEKKNSLITQWLMSGKPQ